MFSQAATPRFQIRLLSSSATLAHRFKSQGTAIHKDRRSAIAVAAAAKTAAASKAPNVQADAVNASNVKAAFAEAGLSQDAVAHVLRRYPPYLRWNVEDRLLPAIQSWQQDLGASFLSELERVPTLLHMKPAEELLKNQYLAFIGIKSPERLRKRSPGSFSQSLTSIQSKVAFLQQWGFTRAQTLSLIEKHPDVLARTSEHTGELLRLIEDMFDCADRETLCDVMLSCRHIGLCSQPLEALHRNFTYCCACIEVSPRQMKRVWKHGLFVISPAELEARLVSIVAQLSATPDEVKSVVRRMPQIINHLPETVGSHVTQLLGLGCSHGQVKSMCLEQPALLTLSFKSQIQADKWAFLTRIMQHDHDAIAAMPYLLMCSLPNKLGPRWEYLQQLRLHGGTTFTGSLSSFMIISDTKFRAAYTRPQLRVYDEHFQQQWQQRWDFLLVDQQLSIEDIADDPDLLRMPLKDT